MRVFVLSHRYLDPARRGKLEALTAVGTEVRVAVPGQWKDRASGRRQATAWERAGQLEIAPVRVSRTGSVTEARWRRSDLQRLLRDFRPDIVHVDEEPTARCASTIARSARALGIPATVSTAQNVRARLPWSVARRRRTVLRSARGIVAESSAAARLAEQTAPGVPTIVLAREGVAVPAAAANVARQPCTIGFVGRLTPERGLDVLLRALETVPGHHWRLAIVGDGPERESLEALARRVHLPARLRWLGALSGDALRDAWLGFDVVVVPSRASPAWADPTGSVAVEAMAHGIPVVVTTSGALPDVVGDAGIVVPEGDPDPMQAALAELVADPARREALGAAGRARAIDRYSDHALARGLLAFWDDVARR